MTRQHSTVGKRRSAGGEAPERRRSRRGLLERLEARWALAAFTPGNLLVSSAPNDSQPVLYEFAPTGGAPLQTIPIVNPTMVGTERPRDLVYDANGNVQIYNGTFDPRVTTYDPTPAPGQPDFTHARYPSWSTGNAVSYGAMTALGDFVFASDMTVRAEDASQRGIIRFNVDNLTAGWSRTPSLDIGDQTLNTATTIPHITITGTGDGTFDYYSFYVPQAGSKGVFDIDYGDTGAPGSFFSYLRLYDSNHTLLSTSDVSSSITYGGGGSTSTRDAYLEYTFPQAGTYIIEVGACCGPTGVPIGSTYQLQVSIPNHSEYILGGSGQLRSDGNNNRLFTAQNTDSAERFAAADGDVIDVNIGLNGLLYALMYSGHPSGGGNVVKVYDPSTLQLLRTIDLPFVHRGIAADAAGNLYTTFPAIYKYNPDGVPLDGFNNPAGGILGDIDIKQDGCFGGAPAEGCIAIASSNGSIILTNRSFTSVDFFKAREGDGTTFVAFVNAPLTLPHATEDFYRIVEDTNANSLNVLINDLVDSRGKLVITQVDPPSIRNRVTVSGGASIRYTPAADFTGFETFTYTVIDGLGGTSTATVTVEVSNVNEPPTAIDDQFTVVEDSLPTPLDPLANDETLPDVGETKTLAAVGTPDQGGTVSISADKLTVLYQPALNFFGAEKFTYVVSDGSGGTATGTVTVTVTNTNDAPTAVNDQLAVNPDTVNNLLDVLANDSDAPDAGETLTILSVSDPPHGATTLVNNLQVRYTPDAGFRGIDTFTYVIEDSNGTQASATVTVTVSEINNPPVALDDNYQISRNSQNNNLPVLNNDTALPDVGETLTIVRVSVPNHGGTVTIANNGSTLRYTPASGYEGTELFQYTVADSRGAETTANVTVLVGLFNSTPVPENDVYTLQQNSTGNVLNVLANDFDPDGNALIITDVGVASGGGTVTISADQRSLIYDAPRPFLGLESFTYTVSDSLGGTALATVTIDVRGWQNPDNPRDTIVDTFVVPDDALALINELNNPTIIASNGLLPPAPAIPPIYYDCNGDGYLTPGDVLLIVNFLNVAAAPEGDVLPLPARLDPIDSIASDLVLWSAPSAASAPAIPAFAAANVLNSPSSPVPGTVITADDDAWDELLDELASEIARMNAW